VQPLSIVSQGNAKKGMINTGRQQLQESIEMCKKHKKIKKRL
jgi:hypothetical protein